MSETAESITVLYVEDESDIRALVELALEDEGFLLHSCASGSEAIEKGATLKPDLMILDVMMPGLDGPSTLERLREYDHLQDTPVIFMTAKVQPTEVDHYLALGAIGVVTKPFDAMALADDLRGLLEAAA